MPTIWVQFYQANSIGAVNSFATDLMVGHVDDAILARATVVAIKGHLQTRGYSISAGVPSNVEIQTGFMVAPRIYTSTDFPNMVTPGTIGPGWMWRNMMFGFVTGDGTNVVEAFNRDVEVDVKSKRNMKGPGLNTLWLYQRVVSSPTAGTSLTSGQILLHID